MNYRIKNGIKGILFQTELGHKLYAAVSRKIQSKRSSLSDRDYVVKAFYENTGKTLNLDSPITFNDKLLWLSLYDRDPMKTRCADKYLVRDYVEKCGFSDILTELYGVFDSTHDIQLEAMPCRFFIKTNHDSGTYALIDQANPLTLKAFERIEQALKRNYYPESREWQYKDIIPKVLCEEYLETKNPLGLIDYRFYCFNGQIGFIAVDVGTTSPEGKHSYVAKRNIYDSEFNLLDAKLKREHFNPNLITKPDQFERMKEIALVLSKPFKHVRVDLYDIDGKIVFGELTFCNAGGMQLLEPEEFNIRMGNMIILE